jgi:hypothetical protein
VHEEGLGGLLQRQDGLRLPAQLLARGLVLEGDFADLGGGKGVLIGGKVFGREGGGILTRREKGSFSMSRSVLAW